MVLARLLSLDDIVSVRVPSVAREVAWDLVCAREDVRGDLTRSRHWVLRLLLRQGIVDYGGSAWTRTDLVWLRRRRLDAASFEPVLLAQAGSRSLMWCPTVCVNASITPACP
jgi:hypothetical protein